MTDWPKKIFVATNSLGVYYTENFETPEIQPTWIAINAGLPSLDVREFWVDPSSPKTRQYVILESTRSIYVRYRNEPWIMTLSPNMLAQGGTIGGFCCDPLTPGRMYAMCGAAGVVYDPDYWYIMYSSDYGYTWQYLQDAGGHTIWTYGIGSIRAYGANIFYFTSQNMGAHASVNNSHIDWNYVPWAVIDPGNPSQPYTTYNIMGNGDLCRLTGIHAEEAADLDYLQDDLGPGGRCDTMWFNRTTPAHSRIIRGGRLYSTRDSWETVYSTTSELLSHEYGTPSGPYTICPLNTYLDIDQMIVGQGGGNTENPRHVIGTIYGEDATETIGIAGSMATTSPFTGSIPWNCGGISQNGIQAIMDISGVYTHAVGMPDYVGPDRGEPMAGDRSAWDVVYYAERHSRDLGLDPPIHHVPRPNGGDCWIYSPDGVSWQTIRIPLSAFSGAVRETILTFSGELTISDNPYRVYNLFGSSQAFSKVFLSVASAPLGQDIIVDIHQDGTTIFENQNNRPRILAGQTTGYTTTFNTTLWESDKYLTAHIDQAGSTYKGSYLVVHIVHGSAVFSAQSSRMAYISGGVRSSVSGHVTAPTGMTKSAYLRGPDPETDDIPAYMRGCNNANDSSVSYTYGVVHPTGSTGAYVEGGY